MAVIKHKSPAAPQRFNEERARALCQGMPWAGTVFDADEASRRLIDRRATRILAARQLGRPPQTVVWWDRDNVEHEFTEDEFLAFAIAVDERVERVYREGRGKKAALGPAMPPAARSR